jgi:hypothetical protein
MKGSPVRIWASAFRDLQHFFNSNEAVEDVCHAASRTPRAHEPPPLSGLNRKVRSLFDQDISLTPDNNQASQPLFEFDEHVEPAEEKPVVVAMPTGPVNASDGLPARLIKPHSLEKFDRHRTGVSRVTGSPCWSPPLPARVQF